MEKTKVSTPKIGEEYMIKSGPQKIVRSCGENLGMWYCLTHKQAFRNQLEKDGHIHIGEHKLAWMCFNHGLEKP